MHPRVVLNKILNLILTVRYCDRTGLMASGFVISVHCNVVMAYDNVMYLTRSEHKIKLIMFNSKLG